MNEELMERVMLVRKWIYYVGLGFLVLTCMSFKEPEVFWPPDMVPHPVVPGDEPSGPGEPVLAAREGKADLH